MSKEGSLKYTSSWDIADMYFPGISHDITEAEKDKILKAREDIFAYRRNNAGSPVIHAIVNARVNQINDRTPRVLDNADGVAEELAA